jgi:16S rRNA G1207 methylase RsmC
VIERVRVEAEAMAKHSKERNREANEQLLAAIARAEKAEQQAVQKIREVDEMVNVQAGIIAKRSKDLSQKANEQLLASIARAEKAEQQSAEKISEAEKRIQEAVESAAQLEKKFIDAMKRMKGSTGM